MKLRKHLPVRLTAFAVAILAGLPASAATIAAGANDLFLAFRATSGQGVDTVYVVELGTYSQTNFPNTVGTTFNLALGNVGTDLSNTFGANWFNRADLNWGLFGSADTVTPTVLLTSRERPSATTQSTPWPALLTGDAADARNSILQVRNYINQNGGTTSTANSNFGFLQNASDTETYAQAIAPTLSPGAPDFATWGRIEGDFSKGATGTSLDLYRFNVVSDANTTVAYRGTFSISQAGVVTYSNLVPEPSAMVLLTLAGSLTLGIRRRRTAPLSKRS